MKTINKPEVIVIKSYEVYGPLAANVRLVRWEDACNTELSGKGKLWVTRNHWTDRGDACKRAWKVEVRTGRFNHYTLSTHYTLDAAVKAAETRTTQEQKRAQRDLAERKAITDRWDARIAAGQNIIMG